MSYELSVSSLRRKIVNLVSKIKACNDLGRLALTDTSKVNSFKGQFRSLEKNYEKFEALVDELTDLCEAEGKAEDYPTTSDSSTIKTIERYFNEANSTYIALSEKEATVAGDRAARLSTTIPLHDSSVNIASSNHLPKINLPEFDGNLLSWPKFKDIFVSLIHDDDALAPVKKFHYLVSSVKGPALGVIQTLPVTTENYPLAWQALCSQYDNKRLLATTYLNEVVNFPRLTGKATVENFTSFLSIVSENVAAFRHLKIEKEADFILFYMASRALDPYTRELLEVHFKGTPFPSFEELSTFIRDRVRALQLADPTSLVVSSNCTTSAKISKSTISFMGSHHKTSLLANQSSSKSNKQKRMESKSTPASCIVCGESHSLLNCLRFAEASAKQRFDMLRGWKGCRNCLSSHHVTKECQSQWHCRFCRDRHHAMLHLGKSDSGRSSPPVSTPLATPPAKVIGNSPVCCNATRAEDPDVLLGTALAEIEDKRGVYHKIRLVIDSGSQFSFITRRFARRLGLDVLDNPKGVGAIGRTIFEGARGRVWCSIKPSDQPSPVLKTSAIVLNEIVCDLPNFLLPDNFVNGYTGYQLADPNFWESKPIDFLLGCDLYPEICRDGIVSVKDGWPKLFPSILGFIVAGRLPLERLPSSVTVLSAVAASPTIQDELQRFWEIEEPGCVNPVYSREEEQCVAHFCDTHSRTTTGQYVVRLPFKGNPPELGDSYGTAKRRFHNLEEKLLKDTQLREQYMKFMQEYCDMEHMAPTNAVSKCIIPHHSVLKEDRSQIKLRVVFDASSKTPVGSLNDHLLTGPKLQKDITSILMNFRRFPVVFTTDVVKMYRFILLDPRDRPYQHVLWRFNQLDPLRKYELSTLTYGLSPAPFLALSVMKQLCEDEGHQFPRAAEVVLRDMYIDDIASGAASVEEALDLQQQLIGLLGRGTFQLSKWSSNRQELLDPVAQTNDQPIDLSTNDDHTIKILGLQWNPTEDCFSYRIQPPAIVATKRSIASAIAKIYDPLGLISPVVMTAKSLLQCLWKDERGWDDPIPADIADEWQRFVEQLPSLSTIRIPRFVFAPSDPEFIVAGFCDASERAYSASIYLRVSDGISVQVHLLTAKTKLAPVKTISVPRLELCGALLLTDTLCAISSFLTSLPSKTPEPILFTDSTVVLGWLSKPSYTLKTFVANRVTKIVDTAPVSRWRHIRSQDNPSDINSRGLFPDQLESCLLWWNGPSWLLDPYDDWPNEFPTGLPEDLTELRPPHNGLPHVLTTVSTVPPLLRWMSTFSSFMKLLRLFSWIRRWVVSRKERLPITTGPILPVELHRTKLLCAKYLQRHFFYEFKDDKADKLIHQRFGNLKPFKDSRGVFRVGGRIGKAKGIPYSQKHPILLPHCHFTELLVDHYHRVHLHPGPGLLQALIQLEYWVPSLRTLVRKRTFLCVLCFTAKAKSQEAAPQMGDLPEYRLAGGRAFLHVGVDFAGPYLMRFSLQRKASLSKVYLCLFICMVTKAVHLEAVTSLSTESFLACFTRFLSRRGLPEQMYSDCGTNFVGAANKLKEFAAWFADEATRQAIVSYSTVRNVSWNFNPPGAPHFGGLWEANVKASKQLINKSLGEAKLTYEELSTLFAQVEAVLNSRPLCPLSSSPDEVDFLSPAHFLIGDHLRRPPEPTLLDISESRLSRWQLVKRMSDYFWKRWRQEYLCTLQRRAKWTEPKENLKVDDLVLLKDSSAPPLDWLLARIIEVCPGTDGTVRVVTLRTPYRTLTRPAVQVVPLLPLKQPAYEKNN